MSYLTKSRFKIGISYPTNLYYESNSSQFDNNNDAFKRHYEVRYYGYDYGSLQRYDERIIFVILYSDDEYITQMFSYS